MSRLLYSFVFIVLLSACHKNAISKIKVTDTGSTAVDTVPAKKIVTVINQGVPGNTAEMLLTRIDSVTRIKPDMTIIMIGTNDVLDGDATYFNFGATLTSIIDSLKLAGSAVMLLTPPPVQSWSFITMNNARLDSVCTTISDLSRSLNCYFVNTNYLFSQTVTAANSQQYYIYDGLHPDSLGYTIIATAIVKYMKSNKMNPAKISCFGDSITYGLLVDGGGTTTGATYPAALDSLLNVSNSDLFSSGSITSRRQANEKKKF